MTGTAQSRVLVLRAAGLGDLVTVVPALRAVARAHPDHRLTLLTPASLGPLARWTGAVDDVVHMQDLAAPPPIVEGVDVAVNLHGRGPQSHRALLASRPRRLIAHRNTDVPESVDGLEWDDDQHEAQRWTRLLEHEGVPSDPSDVVLEVPALEPPAPRGAVVVHPGAGAAARRWPLSRWVEVVRALRGQAHHVVVTGSAEERDLGALLCAEGGLGDGANWAGRLDVMRLAGLIGHASAVLSGDTGVAHLATALRTPSVTLFGPSSPAAWGPWRDHAMHVVLWAGLCGDARGDRTDEGLLRITPNEVLDAFDVLGSGVRAHATG